MSIVDSYKHKGMRRSLVRKMREKGIQSEAVLNAIGNVPRHVFFDEIFDFHAYEDKAFPIAEGQTISQPYTVAFQTELLETTIEYKEKLSVMAKFMLNKMGYDAKFIVGDGSLGYKNDAPYNGIIVTAGAPVQAIEPMVSQLAIGGHLIIPVGDLKKQKMLRITKASDTEVIKQEYNNFSFVPLLGNKGWRE